jgi:hypothetical protein
MAERLAEKVARVRERILVQHILQAAKRIYGVPEFRSYALADGIKQILFGRSGGFRCPSFVPEEDNVLLFPLTL